MKLTIVFKSPSARLRQLKRPMVHKHYQLILRELSKRRLRRRQELNKELTVVFVDKKSMEKINFQYRGKKYATDVLSFSGEGFQLGELILCPQVIKKQAAEHGLSFAEEMAYLMLHGVLHLLGYDHELNKSKAKQMFQIQDSVFAIIRTKI